MEYGTQREAAPARPTAGRRLTTETKHAFKTTEFWIYIVILLGLFIAGLASDGGSDDAIDGFGAERVWLYAVILSVGYMVARGLAKGGVRDPYTEDDGSTGEGLTERVKAAAQVLREGEDTSTHRTTTRDPRV